MPTYGVARVVLDAPDSNAEDPAHSWERCLSEAIALIGVDHGPSPVRFRRYLAADRGVSEGRLATPLGGSPWPR